MLYNDTYSTADLVYLFLDGETNDVQQSVLFGALAANADLQEEFREAMQLRIAAGANKPVQMPPDSMTNTVFASVGIASTAGTAAAVTSSGAGSAFSGLMAGMQGGGGLLISALGAAMVTFLLTVALWDTSAPEEVAADRLVAASRVSSPPEEAESPVEELSIASFRNEIPASPGQMHEGASQPPLRAHTPASDAESAKSLASEMPKKMPIPFVTTHNKETVLPAGLRAKELAAPSVPPGSYLNTRSSTDLSAQEESRQPDPPGTESIPRRFSFQVGSNLPALWFPGTAHLDENPSLIDDFQAGIFYHLDENHSLGVEAGKMSTALYIINAGVFTLEQRIAWVGISYQYRMQSLQFLEGLQPYGQLSLGGSRPGPLLRSVLGLHYSPERVVSFGLGAETALQLFRDQGPWKGLGRLGLSATMFVKF